MASLFDIPLADFGTWNFPNIFQDIAVHDQTQQRWTNEGMYFFLDRMIQKFCENPSDCEQQASGKTIQDEIFVMKDGEKERQEPTVEVFRMNAKGYEPGEISIKIKDGLLCVTAKHEEGNSSGENCVLKELQQEFKIPEGLDPESVRCEMNSDGELCFRAPVSTSVSENDGSILNQI